MKSLCCLLAVSLAWLPAGSAGAATYAPEIGKPHPPFMLPRIDNREAVSLSQFRGQKVLLLQFASW